LQFTAGNHAVVHLETARLQGLDTVALTDQSGRKTLRVLADGLEVEMLAWRVVWWQEGPRMRYRVRSIGDGTEGWVWADFLKPLPGSPAPLDRGRASQRRGAGARSAPVLPSDTPTGPIVASPDSKAGGGDKTISCGVCGTAVNTYNAWRDSGGKLIGCDFCQGRKR
jgi:hypothetical protein